MKSFFNSENFLWQWFARIGDFFLLSCMWTLCSLPLVTVGTASIALYDTVAHCVRGKETDLFSRFFRTFKNELGRGILLTLLWAAVGLILNVGYQVIVQVTAGTELSILGVVCFMLLLIPIGVVCWLVAIESRFVYSFAGLHRTAGIFTMAHLPSTLAIVFLFVAALNLLQRIPFLVMFIPGLTATLQSIFIERVFVKYMPKEEPAE